MAQQASPTYGPGSDVKLAEAMLYVSKRLEELGDRYRGAVKLNKILWRADFESFRCSGRPVTGAQYQRLPEGPAPVRLRPIRDALEQDGEAHQENFDVGAPNMETVLIADRPANLEILTPADLAALDEAIERFRGLSGSKVSEISHRESAGWQSVKNGEIIPYETAMIDTSPVDFPPGTGDRIDKLISAHRASVGTSSE